MSFNIFAANLHFGQSETLPCNFIRFNMIWLGLNVLCSFRQLVICSINLFINKAFNGNSSQLLLPLNVNIVILSIISCTLFITRCSLGKKVVLVCFLIRKLTPVSVNLQFLHSLFSKFTNMITKIIITRQRQRELKNT